MHPLLERQLRRHLGAEAEFNEPWRKLLEAVDRSYQHADSTRELAERALTEMSQELNQRNVELHDRLIEKQATEAALQAEKQEQANLIQRLAETHQQLLQSEKLASIGQLAAGVAHEINNPIGYVHSNLGTLSNYVKQLLAVIDAYESCRASLSPGPALSHVDQVRQAADLDYVRGDVVSLLDESREGIDRVRRIVQDLKEFSHNDQGEWMLADLHKGLDSTLNVVHNEVKYKAQVVRQYGTLPMLKCLPSQLNQVFMNLLVNAAHAIDQQGTIHVRTGAREDEVWVEVSDDGCGIPEELRSRIFDPFFTTKPVGKGTGLGLSISYGIVNKHGGRIEVDSVHGQGTTFRVVLPLHAPINTLHASEEHPHG